MTRTWLLALIMVFGVAGSATLAHADGDVIGLYRLDTDKRLDIYGQAVASELARAVKAHGLAVVVVGQSEITPSNVNVVVSGKIESKGSGLVISLVIRDLIGGKALDASAEAAAITSIDKAAAELSGKLLEKIEEKLYELHHPKKTMAQPHHDTTHVVGTLVTPQPKQAVIAIVSTGTPGIEPLRQALSEAVTPWATAHGRIVKLVDSTVLSRELAPRTAAGANADLAILFEVGSLVVEAGEVPTARARVTVRIADSHDALFERTVVTDTVVGDKGMPMQRVVQRAAREVLAIVAPIIQRKVSGWRSGD